MAFLLWAALLLPAPAGAFDSARVQRSLEHGLWNDRVLAVYELGEQGSEGLELLRCAADDSDWQVRLAAAHFIGKLGTEAVPTLAYIARREPCFHVRAEVLQSLKGLGPKGSEVLAEVMTPEDERDVARSPRLSGRPAAPLGRAITIDPPDSMDASFFNGGDDLRACASAERFEPMKPHLCAGPAMYVARDEPVKTNSDAAEPQADNVLPELPVAARTPSQGKRPAPIEPAASGPPDEIDRLLAGAPETLPPGGALPARAPMPGEAAMAPPPGRALEAGAVRRPMGERELLKPGQAVPGRADPSAPEAGLVDDAGTGKPESDPIPILIQQLSSNDAHRRARAADELGKRGAKARPALEALCKTLKDEDRRARASAALALGGIGVAERSVFSGLRRALRDKDEDVRLSARIALGRLRP